MNVTSHPKNIRRRIKETVEASYYDNYGYDGYYEYDDIDPMAPGPRIHPTSDPTSPGLSPTVPVAPSSYALLGILSVHDSPYELPGHAPIEIPVPPTLLAIPGPVASVLHKKNAN